MKVTTLKTLGKLMIVAAFALITIGTLTATGFAQALTESDAGKSRHQIVEKVREQVTISNFRKDKLSKSIISRVNISKLDQINFNLGSAFIIAYADAAYFDTDEKIKDSVIVDLVTLIDSLEGQPEAAQLQKTLTTVVRNTTTSARISQELETAAKTYASRQTPVQKWYFDSGSAVTRLVFSTYLSDLAAIKKDLAEIQKLTKIAPQDTFAEIITPMNNLAKFIAQTIFTENEYAAIFEGALGLVNSVNA